MPDWDSKIGFLFHDVARFRSIVFDDFMQAHDLTRAQWWVLANLFRRDGLTQRDLAERMEIGAVTMSGLIDRLEAQGWVERRAEPKDRRVKRIWLTARAENIRPTVARGVNKLNRTSMKGLTDAQIETLVEMMRIIRANLLDELNGNSTNERKRNGTA
ncbi:MAG: MarR family transcriptional regulator [Magnetovibrio sp.]|nr:MarR family transcriptional regulator [Magnetovibrio sp.]